MLAASQFGHLALGNLFCPRIAGRGIHQGAQPRLLKQVIPALGVDGVQDAGFRLVTLRVVARHAHGAAPRIAVVNDEARKADMRAAGQLLGLAQQVQRLAHTFHHCRALARQIGDADALYQVAHDGSR